METMTGESQIDRVAFCLKRNRERSNEPEGGLPNVRGAAPGSAGGAEMRAPLALRVPTEHVIHGDRRVDHYAWMRDKKDPRVREYLEAENAYADAVMRPTAGFQEKLYQEMLGRIQQTDLSVPYRLRGYLYYTRTEEGKQYPIYCRKKERPATSDQQPGEEARINAGEGGDRREHEAPDREEKNRSLVSLGMTNVAGASLRMTSVVGRAAGVDKAAEDEEVLLDLNQMAAGHTYMGLGIFEVSEDNQWLAYATDTTGFRQYTLEVKDLRTETVLPFRMERVTSAAWAADNRTLFYVTEDEVTKRSNLLWRHEFGRDGADGQLYEEKDERFRIDVEKSRSGAYLFIVSNSHTASEIWYLRSDTPRGEFRRIAEREEEHEYYVDHHPGNGADLWGGVFFIRTNSGGRTYRLMTASTTNPGREHWHEVIANRPGVMLAGAEAFRTHLVLAEREDGLPYLRIVDLTREAGSALQASRRIEFAEPTYNAVLGTNPEFETTFMRFQYESLMTPRSVYDYNVRTAERILRKRQPVLGDFDPGNYVSERLHARAKDGTLVPISVVRRRGDSSQFAVLSSQVQKEEFQRKDVEYTEERQRRERQSQDPPSESEGGASAGFEEDAGMEATATENGAQAGVPVPRPLVLYGYGSYGLSLPVMFSSNRLSLLDRGVAYAIAHVRGGGELGKPWHDAGRMHRKMNTFTDFLSCAEFLIEKEYTTAEQLVIEGGSAGGLLMGAVTNMRPELFHVVVSHVPFVDVLNTMLDPSLPLTVGEYEEWGNPQVAEDYFYMKQYCPYTNVERKVYPRMLVKTAWNDSQVMYWEAAKYVAKLRAMKTDSNVLLLKTNLDAGHGGASGRYDYLREIAFDYAFLLREVGIRE
jgi:oligopeptidase B